MKFKNQQTNQEPANQTKIGIVVTGSLSAVKGHKEASQVLEMLCILLWVVITYTMYSHRGIYLRFVHFTVYMSYPNKTFKE